MRYPNSLSAVFVSALLLTLLFFRQGIGLNLLLFECLLFTWLAFTKQLTLGKPLVLITFLGTFTTGIFTVLIYSTFVYTVHFISLFLFVGVLNFNSIKSLLNAFGMASATMFTSQIAFAKQFFGRKVGGIKVANFLWKSRIFVIPILIIGVFLTIYSFSNPIFSDYLGAFGELLQNGITFLFENINFPLFFTFLFCLFLSVFLLYRTAVPGIQNYEATVHSTLYRNKMRKRRFFKLSALKSEYKAGIFLLVILNLLLLLLNCIDIYWVWFNFEWDGQTLKQFVHEGTYLLIISILISIAVVLYFFRGNLNFYKNNKWLKYLAYVWVAQNAILAISVAIRNFWYIKHFALAYKRIGVVLFLLLVLYGLFTVFRKIQKTKTAFYLFQKNTLALYLILIASSLVNWDSVIAKYNFSNADNSYLHLAYLSNLSDKTLPLLDKTKGELLETYAFQQAKFPYPYFTMNHDAYLEKIEKRKKEFQQKWEAKNILAWNLAEYRAYHNLLE
ncbi:MAG: hypothetical protein CMC13_03940 [Flavobacteriaceae bacterium]|nr:hypothetical protein [Flavobacteriaceae bacterium]|tara:strand:+ start:3070 stop:4575 length:1506 start_codon:yes stop_codon:yes gene_type:complete